MDSLGEALGLWFLLLVIIGAGIAIVQKPDCHKLSDGRLASIHGDTLFIESGVGYALRVDTVRVRPGLTIRVLDCGL